MLSNEMLESPSFMALEKFFIGDGDQIHSLSSALSDFVFRRMENYRPVPNGFSPKEWAAMSFEQQCDWHCRTAYEDASDVSVGLKRILCSSILAYADAYTGELNASAVAVWALTVGIPRGLAAVELDERDGFANGEYLHWQPVEAINVRLAPFPFRHNHVKFAADANYVYAKALTT